MALRHTEANWTQALADLREAPAKPRGAKSLRQAIEDAIDDIISCRERGHTDSDIVAIFAQNGIHMSLHTFRLYVRQARRAKAEQALGGKRKVLRVSKAQSRDILGDSPTEISAEARDTNATPAVTLEVQGVDMPAMTPVIVRTNCSAAAISQTTSKPLIQTRKTAAEVLGHRFSEDV